MIPVTPQQEPADFDMKVRKPGQNYLRINPNPSGKEFRSSNSDYWRLCLPQLRDAYRRVCAYSSLFIPGSGSIDHFIPKSVDRRLAYEWRNYRLATPQINNNKGENVGVLDPFTIKLGWFILDPATLWVHPESTLAQALKDRVQRTINVLRLNDDSFVQYRFQVFSSYIDGKLVMADLESKHPFIAAEITRQGIKTTSQKLAEAMPIKAQNGN